MCRFKTSKNGLVASVMVVFVLCIATITTYSQESDGRRKLNTPIGDIAFEVVGQVTNFPPAAPDQPATSQQYGYLSLINGLTADQIFITAAPTLQNEATARFTFFRMPSLSVSSATVGYASLIVLEPPPSTLMKRRTETSTTVTVSAMAHRFSLWPTDSRSSSILVKHFQGARNWNFHRYEPSQNLNFANV
ncbi:MAG: hypothetical protein ACREBG_13920 [Pyrinomonadaceae bacterium]